MKKAIIFLAVTTLVGCADAIGPFIKYQEVEGVKVPHFFYRTTSGSPMSVWYDYRTVAIPCSKAKTEKEKFMCGL
jgi:hypothetical protein